MGFRRQVSTDTSPHNGDTQSLFYSVEQKVHWVFPLDLMEKPNEF